MKNKIFNTIFTFIFLTANAGLCEQPRTAVNPLVKFGFAMGGVVLSAIIIYAGIIIYKKLFIRGRLHTFEDEILKTPKTTEEAIKFFIHKNKLS